MRRGSVATALAAALSCAAGCAQVLGLDSYGPASGDGGSTEDATMEAAPEGASDVAAERGDAADATPLDADATTPDAAGDGMGADGAGDGDAVVMFDAPGEAGCTGVLACAPVAPAGWSGPIALWEGTGGPPSCSAGYAAILDGGAGLQAPPAQCTCTCGSPAGASCGPIELYFTKSACAVNCGPDSGNAVTIAGGQCANLQAFSMACGGSLQISVDGSAPSGGSCTADASSTVTPWSWDAEALACAPTVEFDAGCGAGEICLPALQAPFEAHPCVWQAGANLPCPGNPYSAQRVYYGSASDDRGCTACGCGGATAVDCNQNGQVLLYSGGSCTNQTGTITPLPQSCVTPAGSPHSGTFTTTPTGGSCAPQGGAPTGGVTPQSAVTICCEP